MRTGERHPLGTYALLPRVEEGNAMVATRRDRMTERRHHTPLLKAGEGNQT